MKTALIAAAALVATSLVSQANETVKYDSTRGMSIEGAYAWAGRDHRTNTAGGLLSMHHYIYSGSVYSQVSLTSGCLAGSETWHRGTPTDRLDYKHRLTYIPVLAGYTMNVPVTDGLLFYIGAKAGIGIVNDKTSIDTYTGSVSDRVSGAKFSYAFSAGIKISLGDHTDLKLGYEQYRTQYSGSSNPYHAVQAGVSWNF